MLFPTLKQAASAAVAVFAAGCLLLAPAHAADTAEQLMKKAHDGRAVWNAFPGFSADLVVRADGKQASGTLKVAADGKLTISVSPTEGAEWVERTLSSVVNHRLAEGEAVANVAFADEEANHPLGRLIKSRDAADHNQWRVKGDVMTEVHRDMGKSRFIISVADVSRNKEGKHLPRSFTVTTWDSQSGAIVSARQVYNEWVRVGELDLPARLLAMNSKSDGSRRVEEVVLTNHKVSGAAKATAFRSQELAPLKAPVTSFGAAVADNHLYVYSGHLGTPHEYAADFQSTQMVRLNLAKPEAWEVVGDVPRRTGLAMVAYGGKLFRVGGWEAKNAKGEKSNLHSTKDFVRFDPKSGKWQDLAPMPTGRSSHDAALVGSKLYVAGGWELGGAGDGTWHDTALVCDLADAEPKWKEIAKPPFTRRALAVAGFQDRLYAIGGMNDSNEITTATTIFDEKSGKWLDGPAIPGMGFDGFGASAFGISSGLYVTNASGKLFRLAPDGKSWQDLGDLARPRTFHRLVSDEAGGLLIVGGTSRPTGKVAEVERLTFPGDTAAR